MISMSQEVLADILAVPSIDLNASAGSSVAVDCVIATVGRTFVAELTSTTSAGVIAAHAERALQATQRFNPQAIPLVVVPFMHDSGRQACRRLGVSWFDLSGNARIIAPGLRVIIDGRPNRFRARGRPASLFAPKSSRVARWLLMHPTQAFTQRQVAHATDLSEGLVSRIVSRLEEQHYVVRDEDGTLRVKDPRLLLEAWQDEYRFSKHTIVQGHVAARSGDALTRIVSDALRAAQFEHAATGLAAAWQLTHFAMFRITTFYLATEPRDALKDEIGFRDDPRGANLWLVVPSDAGVFHGAEDRDGVRCVHPVQAYLDLAEHPERAAEAAEHLRAEFLDW
ncbi:type IV toxin-antitoxin system AbiEi family antitoxin [Haliangium sp.]|uniref:type IV toxin-antitoxin system AbiEi family antitoxin n=1 Tax=Haliangium sp. TaxID=2663208 RepID=UPI003D09F73F